jgi:uncharacterized protein YjbK
MEEKEYKVIIDLEKYNRILNQFDWDTFINQHNYYYDSKNFWAEEYGYTIRIRQINNDFILQIKSPNQSQKIYKHRIESELGINHIPQYLDSSILNPLKNVDGCPGRLELLGFLETERHIKCLSNDITLFLDKNQYGNILDYEVEVEFSKDNREAEKVLFELGLKPYRTCGKYTRFVKYLMNFKNDSSISK